MLKAYCKNYDNSLLDASSENVPSTYHNLVTYKTKTNTLYLQSDSSCILSSVFLSGESYYLQYTVAENATYIDLTSVDGVASGTILLVEEEEMLVESVNTSTKRLIVSRGYNSTTPARHNSSIRAQAITDYTELFAYNSRGEKTSPSSFGILDPIVLEEDIDENTNVFKILDVFSFCMGDTFTTEDSETATITSIEAKDGYQYLTVTRSNPQPHLAGDTFFLTSFDGTYQHKLYYSTSPIRGSAEGTREDMSITLVSQEKNGDESTLKIPLRTVLRLAYIGTIGDSITAGHAAFRAEDHKGTYCRNGISYANDNTSEDVTSQYQYWLSYRLGKNYNVYNYGTGEEVGYQVGNRFVKEILSLRPDYVIIQCGTNDLSLFNGATAVSGIDASATMDEWIFTETPIVLERNGSRTTYYGLVPAVKQMVELAREQGIITIVGNLLPRNGLSSDMIKAFQAYNSWLESYVAEFDDVYMVDFLNAAEDGEYIRNTPDSTTDYDMNDRYSSGAVIDESGNVTKSGDGIHLNSDGYRIMGYCMNIDVLFDASVEGFDLYLQPDASTEPLSGTLDTTTNLTTYTINFKMVQTDLEKTATRYLYNKGTNSELYYVYSTRSEVLTIEQDGEQKSSIAGTLLPGEFLELKLRIVSKSRNSTGQIRVVGRPIETI